MKKKKVIVKPLQKKVARSQTQALSQLLGSMAQLVASQAKRHKALLEFGKEREKSFIQFRQEEAERNRQHELQIVIHFSASYSKSTIWTIKS